MHCCCFRSPSRRCGVFPWSRDRPVAQVRCRILGAAPGPQAAVHKGSPPLGTPRKGRQLNQSGCMVAVQPDLHHGSLLAGSEKDVQIADQVKASISLFATALPLVERSYRVLPVAQRIREDSLPAAVLASLLCVIAGYATARHSNRGLDVGWPALVLFLGVLVALLAFMDVIPRGERGLYVLCFALFSLSAASFLSIKRDNDTDVAISVAGFKR